jgi:SPP1 gp7 family putative phage head morphogenesis protein
MTRVAGPSVDQLDHLGDDYAALVARTLAQVANAAGNRDVEDLGALRTAWANGVEEALLPALGVAFEVGAAQIRVGLREAAGLTAAALADVPATSDALADAYLAQARNRLVGVGDELWQHAREELLEGLRAGESVSELAARVRRVAPDLTEPRASVIARTEIAAAVNHGAYEQVKASGATGRKTWIAAHDTRVRHAHRAADGQQVSVHDRFSVGGFPMLLPHDPAAPPGLTVNCRCTVGWDLDVAKLEPVTVGQVEEIDEPEPPAPVEAQQRDRSFLARVFRDGLAALVGWFKARTASAQGDDDGAAGSGQPLQLPPADDRGATRGAPDDPLRAAGDGGVAERAAAGRPGEVTGRDQAGGGDVLGQRRPGPDPRRGLAAAAGEPNTGAMIALVPSEADLDRLPLGAVDGAEPREELHLTLAFLGEADAWAPSDRGALIAALSQLPALPVVGDGFGANYWNPGSDSPSWNLAVGGVDLEVAHGAVWEVLRNAQANMAAPEIPEQHAPWSPHVCLAYTPNTSLAGQVADRTGPIVFDRLRVAFGEAVTDLPLAAAMIDQTFESEGGDVTAAATEPTVAANGQDGAWEGVLVVEGTPTGDGRQFASGALTWAELPLPLKWQEREADGHDGAVIVGRIDSIERQGDQLVGRGVFDLEGEHGREAHRLVDGRFMRGVSIMPDDISDEDVELEFAEGQEDDPFARPKLTTYNAGRVRSATLCAEAAFVEAEVRLTGQPAVVAAASLDDYRPPAAWFTDPGLPEPTGIVVDEDGRVRGHAALFESCHIGYGEVDCVSPPFEADHPYFLTGEVVCADGSRVAVGQITLATGHAPLSYGAQRAAEHYDNTGAVVADVTCGNDGFGIWVAGAIRPGTDPARVHELRASGQLSGDWRRIGGQLRLVGLLAVNVPGFPVPRPRARVASGSAQALVAAGKVAHDAGQGAPDLSKVKARIVRPIMESRKAAAAARVRG